MITLIQRPDELNLSGNLPKFMFFSDDPISFEIHSGEEVLFVGNYSPGKDRKITIDVKEIVEARMKFNFMNVLEVYEQAGVIGDFTAYANGELISTFRVVKAGVSDFGMTAKTFLQQHFMTWQPRDKKVSYSSPEYLTYYAVDDCELIIRGYFPDPNGDVKTRDIVGATMTAGHAYTIPLMYACVAGKFQNYPSSYDVCVKSGDIRWSYIQRYTKQDAKSEQEEYVLFENSLGGIDSFRAYGDTDYQEQNTHNVATIDDQIVPYRIDTENVYEKNTGYLSQEEQVWLRDFFPSTQKYIFKDGVLHGIVLLEDNVKSSSAEPVGYYSFTYRHTDDTIYLNIPVARSRSMLSQPLNVTLPDMQKFNLEPRLAEYPAEKVNDGTLFPVQEPFGENWKAANAGGIANYIIQKINQMTDGRLLDNRFKGYFNDLRKLQAAYPNPLEGESAWAGTPFPGIVFFCDNGAWNTKGDIPEYGDIQLADYVGKAELLQETGNSTNIPMSQDATTKEVSSLQQQIDGIVAQNAKLTLSVSPSVIYDKVGTEINLTANLSGSKERISILKGGIEIAHADNASSATAIDNISATTTYTAKANVKGRALTASATVSAYAPIYFGAAYLYGEVISEGNKQTPRSTPYGYTYKAKILTGNKAVFAIPESMSFDPKHVKDADTGFGFPMDLVDVKDGYKYYQSGEFISEKTITLTIKK